MSTPLATRPPAHLTVVNPVVLASQDALAVRFGHKRTEFSLAIVYDSVAVRREHRTTMPGTIISWQVESGVFLGRKDYSITTSCTSASYCTKAKSTIADHNLMCDVHKVLCFATENSESAH